MAAIRASAAAENRWAWRLHQATETMELDFFGMLFVSGRDAWLARPGNDAAADAFSTPSHTERRAAGLPATSINWGPWSGSGMAARLDHRDQARLTEAGWRMIEVHARHGCDGPRADRRTRPTGRVPVDWRRFTKVGGVTPLLEEIGRSDGKRQDGRASWMG